MTDKIKDISNSYEIVTLNSIKISKKVVEKVKGLTDKQRNVLFWELLADKTRTIRDKSMLNLIKEIEENVS